MNRFVKICDIERVGDNYADKVFLTFDIDWASDEVLEFCINLLKKHNISATYFVTHETPLLQTMIESPEIELGIHPNFNFLLNGDFRYGKNFLEVIDYYLEIVPEAVSVRSHSLVQGSPILEAFSDRNLKYDLNLLIPSSSNIQLKPFKGWQNDFTRLPFFWEDDTHLLYNDPNEVNLYLDRPGLKIFNFHPIHVFLNTENLARYNDSRAHLNDFNLLEGFVNNSTFGTRDFLENLIGNNN